jgi:recombinational DNA repair protein (RecF pathway)
MVRNLRAVVLWSRRSREADKVVGLFTDQLGRITARATSAARSSARFAALTEPFVECEIAFLQKPGQGWGKLVGGRLVRTFPKLRTELERSTAASWVCEVVARMTPEEQPSPDKFSLLLETLEALEDARYFGTMRLAFAVRFLELAGFGLENQEAWIELEENYPDRATSLLKAPIASLSTERWPEPAVKALEVVAGGIVADHLHRPLSVNRFRQMTGIEI